MANLITLFRFALLFVLVVMAYQPNPYFQLVNMPLLVVVLVLDAVDGYVARKRNESSLFGAIFDIIVDRVVENVLWIVLADLRLVPTWVAIVFITRSLVVDSIRSHGAKQGKTPFGMAASRWAQFLVAGRFMRGLYGTLKALVFGWIFLLQPWPKLIPAFWESWKCLFGIVSGTLIYITAALCILRSIPVIVEFAITEDIFAPLKKIGKNI
jgi:CDP-diacylglycerol--glycerol-3-phosphate 3-phosphatidyltransferase